MMDHIDIRLHRVYCIISKSANGSDNSHNCSNSKGKHTFEILDICFIGDTMEIIFKNESGILALKSNVASPQLNKTK
jgi:hypothetical protein